MQDPALPPALHRLHFYGRYISPTPQKAQPDKNDKDAPIALEDAFSGYTEKGCPICETQRLALSVRGHSAQLTLDAFPASQTMSSPTTSP